MVNDVKIVCLIQKKNCNWNQVHSAGFCVDEKCTMNTTGKYRNQMKHIYAFKSYVIWWC